MKINNIIIQANDIVQYLFGKPIPEGWFYAHNLLKQKRMVSKMI